MLALALLLAPSAVADTFWDLPPEQIEALAAAIEPGDLLLRWCPGCGGEAVLFRVGPDRVAPGTYSEGFTLRVPWKALAVGPAADGQEVFAAAPACAEAPVCLAAPEAPCAGKLAHLDVPYTWRLEPSGAWTWLGTLAGADPQGTMHEAPIRPDPAWIGAARACRPVRGGAPASPPGEAGD